MTKQRQLNLYFLFFFTIYFFSLKVFSNDTSTGGQSNVTPVNRNNISRSKSIEFKADSCPPALTEWIQDDFTDKTSIFGLLDFPSDAQSCMSAVKSYEDAIKKSGRKTTLDESLKLGTYLADRYKQISPNAKEVLNKCSILSDCKDNIDKSIFYISTSILVYFIYNLLVEFAYIDSINPKNQSLNSMECSSIFPFPQVGRKCDEYKKMLNGSCKQSQTDRLNTLVKKTKEISDKIDELKIALRNCTVKNSATSCQNISLAIQILTNEAPWIEGKKFQEKFINVKANPFLKEAIKDEQIKQGILEQLNENRKSYLQQYKNNLQQVKCLTYSTGDGKAPCDFEETRNYISKLPDLVDPTKPSNESREFDHHIQAEKCLIERGINRADTKRVVEDAATDVAITIATAGIGTIANGGLKFVKGMSTVSKIKNASFASSALAGMNLSSSAKQAFQSCTKTSEGLLKFSGKPETLKENLCPESSSQFEIAKESYTGCITDALLTAVDVWPFVKGLKMASQLSKFSNDDLLKQYKDPKQREEIEKILAKNGSLTDPERTDAAEKLLGRKLSSSEKSCILNSHYSANDKFMRTSSTESMDLPMLSTADLLSKKSILSACGIQPTEIALLMRAGITGNMGTDSIRTAQSNYAQAKKFIDDGNALPGSYAPHSLFARSAQALEKDAEATAAYARAYTILADKSGLSRLAATNSNEVQKILNGMSSREIMDLSDFAAGSGKIDHLGLIEQRRLQILEQEATYGMRQNSLESIQAGKKNANQAYRDYIDSLRTQARSSNPLTKKIGEARLKALGL